MLSSADLFQGSSRLVVPLQTLSYDSFPKTNMLTNVYRSHNSQQEFVNLSEYGFKKLDFLF